MSLSKDSLALSMFIMITEWNKRDKKKAALLPALSLIHCPVEKRSPMGSDPPITDEQSVNRPIGKNPVTSALPLSCLSKLINHYCFPLSEREHDTLPIDGPLGNCIPKDLGVSLG